MYICVIIGHNHIIVVSDCDQFSWSVILSFHLLQSSNTVSIVIFFIFIHLSLLSFRLISKRSTVKRDRQLPT